MNHEYCEDCGASDFHHGRLCDPDRLAIKNKERADTLARNAADREKLKSLISGLEAAGFRAELHHEFCQLIVRVK